MKAYSIIFATVLLLIGCSEAIEQQTLSPNDLDIENASIADCLEIIQDSPKSDVFQKALDRYLLLTTSNNYCHVLFRKSLGVHILSEDSVILDGLYCPLDSVRFKCCDYLTTEGPWKGHRSKDIGLLSPSNLDSLYFSKGLLDVVIAGDSIAYGPVQTVFIEISKAINDYKEYLGLEWFDKQTNDLSYEEDSLIGRAIGLRIQVFHFPNGFPRYTTTKTIPNNW